MIVPELTEVSQRLMQTKGVSEHMQEYTPSLTPAHMHSHGSLESSSVAQGKLAFSQWLDVMRWIAALSVVLAHSANRFLVRITDVDADHRTVAFYFFSLLAGFAHEAVMIFFVLSGYLVGGGLWKEARSSTSIDLPKYLIKRVSRLCIVLYPTFMTILLLNLLGIYAFNGLATGVYAAKVLHTMQPASFACNAVFMQTALCEPYGDDGALWSLYNEFWYYLIWPLIVLGILAASMWRRAFLLIAASFLLVALTLIQSRDVSAIGPYMFIWVLGVGVAAIPRPLIRSCLASVVMFLLGLSADRLLVRRTFAELHPVGGFFVDALISVLFANLLVTMRFHRSLRLPIGTTWNTWLASFSFSLYCIHIPILNLYGAVLTFYTGAGWQMVPDRIWKWGVVLGALALSVVSAYGFSRLTEAHTEKLRRCLLDALASARPADPPRGRVGMY